MPPSQSRARRRGDWRRAPRLRHVRPAATTTANHRCSLAHHVSRRETARDRSVAQHRDERHLSVVPSSEDDRGLAQLPANPIREVHQGLLVGEVAAGRDDLDAVDVLRGADQRLRLLARLPPGRLGQAPLELGEALRGAPGAGHDVARAQNLGRLVERTASVAEPVDRRGSGEGLDAPHVRGARTLGDDREDADLRAG